MDATYDGEDESAIVPVSKESPRADLDERSAALEVLRRNFRSGKWTAEELIRADRAR